MIFEKGRTRAPACRRRKRLRWRYPKERGSFGFWLGFSLSR